MSELIVIFDIDGTLCDTFDADDECFCAVAAEMLGVPFDQSSWEGSPHITDSGILEWLYKRHRGRLPTQEKTESFVSAYESALARELERAPGRFAATAGAATILERLREINWDVAIARADGAEPRA